MSIILTKVGNSYNTAIKLFEADAITDLNDLDVAKIQPGSKVHVIEEDRIFILNNSKQWVQTTPSFGYGDIEIEGISESSLAEVFSSLNSYVAGDFVIHQGELYQFVVDHPAGDWIGSDVREIQLAEELEPFLNSINTSNNNKVFTIINGELTSVNLTDLIIIE